jgi:hypothetical protein
MRTIFNILILCAVALIIVMMVITGLAAYQYITEPPAPVILTITLVFLGLLFGLEGVTLWIFHTMRREVNENYISGHRWRS